MKDGEIFRRGLILSLASVPFLATTERASADLYDDYINSSSRKLFVSFFARSLAIDSPGHSFVAIGVELDNGLTVYERFMGLYPAGGILKSFKSAITPVDGAIAQKFADLDWSVEYQVDVTVTQHRAATEVTDRWLADTTRYSLLAQGGSNCNLFAAEVAQAIGLSTPKAADKTLPQIFIKRIAELND